MQLLEFEKPAAELERELEKLRSKSNSQNIDMSAEISIMESKLAETRARIYKNLTPWQRVQIARHPRRPYALDYIGMIFEGFQELHGDRQYNDDRAIIGGTAFFNGDGTVYGRYGSWTHQKNSQDWRVKKTCKHGLSNKQKINGW